MIAPLFKICAVFLPLLSSIVSGILSLMGKERVAALASCIIMIICCITAIITFIPFTLDYSKVEIYHIANLIDIGALNINFNIYLDSLSSIMMVMICLISSLVHIYSIGYMSEDPYIGRFMSYLSLFTFAMLQLIVSSNFVQLFFGWEGVGLCSYLLIGFWYQDIKASNAAMKAFIVNRIGDTALIIALCIIYYFTSSLDYEVLFKNALKLQEIDLLGLKAIDIICILLFIGCMGKSAQFGLHIWLPDAMLGPTPVSALIHAATMVTAGVFLVARCSYVFEYSSITLTIITSVGILTSLFAATTATMQTDIKKTIAYSTCSQLGLMFLACGMSFYHIAIFHLLTHAFFKALLFLSAGSVIHSMHHEQNIFNMGGIKAKLPITFAVFLIGSLSISGVYPLAGYYSKELIIESTSANYIAHLLCLSIVFFTAFYSFKLLFIVFLGEENKHSIHEAPKSMLIPLLILAFFAIFAGIIGEKLLHINDLKIGYLKQSIFSMHASLHNDTYLQEVSTYSTLLKFAPKIFLGLGILSAYIVYMVQMKNKGALGNKGILNLVLYRAYFIDEIYNFTIVKFYNVQAKVCKFIDVNIIDKCGPMGISKITYNIGEVIANMHTGKIYHYAATIICAAIVYYEIFFDTKLLERLEFFYNIIYLSK